MYRNIDKYIIDTEIHSYVQLYRQISYKFRDTQMYRNIDKQIHKYIDIKYMQKKYRLIERQTEIQSDRQTDKHSDKRTDRR